MIRVTTKCNTGCGYIDDYLNAQGVTIPACSDILMAREWIIKKLDGATIDIAKTERAKELIERYFEMPLLPWELLVLSLVHCYEPDGTLVFTEFLIMMGRGNGKNGFISGLAWYLTTKYHGIRGYNVDIIANSEDQAETSFMDIYDMLTRTWEKSRKWFYKSKETIDSLRTGSYIHYNTSNARTKDGKRSACLIFDEEHEYETGASIGVFTSGFGKRKHSRIFKITTQGYVRDGVLDNDLSISHAVLNGEIPSSRLCPLLFQMDTDEQCDDPDLWVMANPSLPYFPNLKIQMDQDFLKKAYDKQTELDWYTKRMNRPRSNMEIAVTEWDNIAATNIPLPDMTGWQCTAGIDYASLRDWASVNLHFRKGERRYDINHSWLCAKSPDLSRIHAPWQEWAAAGQVTVVQDVEIAPELLTEYIYRAAIKYNITCICLDNFRFALMREALEKIGFDPKERKNVRLIRPSDIMKIQPVIASCFLNHLFAWGDYPPLRWATNNTKLVRSGKAEGTDTGNYYYAKIEGKSRKTDPFMALVASMAIEDSIVQIPDNLPSLDVIVG